MTYLKPVLVAAFLLGAFACSNAWARPGHDHAMHGTGWHGHTGGHFHAPGRFHHGVVVGGPLFWPGYWYDPYFYDPVYPYYYYGPRVYLPPRNMHPGAPESYFCSHPRGYYPHVRECLVPWNIL